MRDLTVGKARGLQQLSNSDGIFTICALDHRISLRKMMGSSKDSPVTYQTMVDFKLDLCEALAPYASGVLLDPSYGASQAISANVLPGGTGLLMSLDAVNAGNEGHAAELMQEWNVEKVRNIGASGAKLTLHYRPDLPNMASEQLNAITRLAYDCMKADLALFLEPKNYIVRELERDPWEFARKKPELAVETVAQLSKLPVDVLKVEFPADIAYEHDKGRLLDFCQQVGDASTIPWVLLSGGISYEVFCEQLELACKAGASGFLAGRALWQEAASIPPRQRLQRYKFLEKTAVERLNQLTAIASNYGRSWVDVVEMRNNYLYPDLSEEWDQIAEIEELFATEQTAVSDYTSEANP